MLSEICFEIKNYFCRNPKDKHYGDFKIENGVISPSYDLKNGTKCLSLQTNLAFCL